MLSWHFCLGRSLMNTVILLCISDTRVSSAINEPLCDLPLWQQYFWSFLRKYRLLPARAQVIIVTLLESFSWERNINSTCSGELRRQFVIDFVIASHVHVFVAVVHTTNTPGWCVSVVVLLLKICWCVWRWESAWGEFSAFSQRNCGRPVHHLIGLDIGWSSSNELSVFLCICGWKRFTGWCLFSPRLHYFNSLLWCLVACLELISIAYFYMMPFFWLCIKIKEFFTLYRIDHSWRFWSFVIKLSWIHLVALTQFPLFLHYSPLLYACCAWSDSFSSYPSSFSVYSVGSFLLSWYSLYISKSHALHILPIWYCSCGPVLG